MIRCRLAGSFNKNIGYVFLYIGRVSGEGSERNVDVAGNM